MALEFVRVPRAQMEANHRAYHAARAKPARQTIRANIEPVLDLGDTCYIPFRGRAFGVPPVGWRLSQRLASLRIRATEAVYLTKQTNPAYYATLGELARVLWRHSFPTGKIPRLLKRLGLARNPFMGATEAELVQLTDFFLLRRMTSSIGVPMASRPPSMMRSTI